MNRDYQMLLGTIARHEKDFKGLDDLKWFKKYLRENLHVYKAAEKLAFELFYSKQREYYSMWMIGNKLRWDTYVAELGSDYKINNNAFAYFSRLIMAHNPRLSGMFRTKTKPEDTL